ncbi:MAG: Clp protease N-terminal domain-containing protein, partial [Bdellovibrionia bacterium]
MATQFTVSAQEALQQAQAEAMRRDHQELQPEHLLYALVASEDGSGIVPNILKLAEVDIAALKRRLEERLDKLPKVSGGTGQIYASNAFNRVLALAEGEAKQLEDEYVSGEHFLLSLLSPQLKDTEAAKMLKGLG